MNDKPITIPADAKRVLLVAGHGYCSLFLNGKRERMFVLDREDDNHVTIGMTVKKLAELASVTIIHVDIRVLMPDPETKLRDKRWFQTLAEAVKRQEELNEAAVLRARVKADSDKAAALEAAR